MGSLDVLRGVQPVEEFALDPAGSWLEALFQEHYPRIVGMLARLIGDRGQAEEIGSDVFCKLSHRPTLFRGHEANAPWLYRVAMNAGLDAVRANQRRRRREQQAGVEMMQGSAQRGALDEMMLRERRMRVREVLAEMKPRDAQLVLLRAEGVAYRELGQTLGIQAGSVGTLLARAEQDFERRFRKRYGDSV